MFPGSTPLDGDNNSANPLRVKTPSIIRAIISLIFMVFALAAQADAYKSGDSFVGFKAADQHGTPFTFKPGSIRFVIFDTPEGEASESPQDPKWFEKHHALMVINLTELSAFKRRIARSRAESKPFSLLLVEDKDVAAKFPRQKEKFTVLLVDEQGKITDVKFVTPGKELQALLSGDK